MNKTIPALSLRQPWAWAILCAGKDIENRTWSTNYRGRIRIHAAKTWDEDGNRWLNDHGFFPLDWLRPRDLGAYVGEVTVVDCCKFTPCLRRDHGAWPFGPICWILENPMAYSEPIPGRGYPGLYLPERFRERDN